MARKKRTNPKYAKYKAEGRREKNKARKAEKLKKKLARAKANRLAKEKASIK